MSGSGEELDRLLAGTPFAGDAVSQTVAPLFIHRALPGESHLFLEGEIGGSFAVVAEGKLRAYRQLAGGRELTVFWFRRGDWFGFLPLLDGGPYPVSVASVEPSRVFMLRRDEFLSHLRRHPELGSHLLAHLARRFRTCLDQLGTLGRPGALARLAAAITSLVPPGQVGRVEVDLPVSQAELARTLGVAPENLSRAMTRLIRDGLVARRARRHLTVLDTAALSRLAQGEPLFPDDRH